MTVAPSPSKTDSDYVDIHGEEEAQLLNKHDFKLIENTSQLMCHQCHDRIGNSPKPVFECTVCGFLCHYHCLSSILLSCPEMNSLQHGEVLYVMVDDDIEKNRWLRQLELLRMMALVNCQSIS